MIDISGWDTLSNIRVDNGHPPRGATANTKNWRQPSSRPAFGKTIPENAWIRKIVCKQHSVVHVNAATMLVRTNTCRRNVNVASRNQKRNKTQPSTVPGNHSTILSPNSKPSRPAVPKTVSPAQLVYNNGGLFCIPSRMPEGLDLEPKDMY
ncbi:hypothetical protein VTK26DRAFT_121 [Humicola hyalothermophila]